MAKTITKEFKQTEIGEIPADWDLRPLRSVCEETTTINPAKNPSTVIEYVDVSAVSREGCRIISTTKYAGKDAPGRARNLVRQRDVIFATVRPTLRRVAIIPKALDGQVVSTAFCVIRALETQAHPEYIYYMVSSPDFVARVGRLERGASYPAVTDANILNQNIALPPKPEQEQIAGVLSKIQRMVENQEKIISGLRELKAATIAKLFREGLRGEPLKQIEIGEIPQSWADVRIDSKYVFTAKPREQRISNYKTLSFLPMDMIPKGGQNITEYMEKSVDAISSGTYFEEGDLLVSKITPCFENGKQGIVKSVPLGFGVATTEVIPIKALPGISDVRFLSLYLLEPNVRQILAGKMQGATGRQRLDKTLLEAWKMPFPSLSEQQEIADLVDNIQTNIEAAESKSVCLRALFSSTLHQLMNGRVRVL